MLVLLEMESLIYAETPKSAILTSPLELRRMLAHFISLWIFNLLCKYYTPNSNSLIIIAMYTSYKGVPPLLDN